MNAFERLYWLRMFGHTVRFHSQRYVGDRETILHHSASAALLLVDWLGDNCSAKLLRAALTHDLPEGITGDIPAPVKWALHQTAQDSLDELECKVCEHYNIDAPGLTKDECALLKAADFIDVCFTCVEQRLMGNIYITRVFARLCAHEDKTQLLSHPAVPKVAKELFLQLCAVFHNAANNTPWQIPLADAKDFWENAAH